MSVTDIGHGTWRKSSYSTNGNCVEVGSSGGADVVVRDSENTGGPVVTFPAAEWKAFLRRVKAARPEV
ncbi:DUF397 domain-containing protein [Sphaerisporangium corydalis]|uniref:DUF397 domain-containing protein n=1 Tax=Sphaerisporangium corydalis TaxID=1441875 RepID=A0ABV9EJQ6_9ACTN|nr:DUF397 domain-containing protein [Sphaerisporangium corydalis]